MEDARSAMGAIAGVFEETMIILTGFAKCLDSPFGDVAVVLHAIVNSAEHQMQKTFDKQVEELGIQFEPRKEQEVQS
jgi:hypothetical protein